ncbi:sigma-70 family RNA polymerase sigma factor [Methylobacterium platani]|uniref:RNA polymerase sigma factor n=2 Tax=Methylobacterium platani TaxID=427683 RepID=A0A179SD92_9HYPH|nr:sigma-70 family RNA polymerase sigma factor [Methylobacterium platani]KMO17148.1 RNA polymerase subunit sigma-70 [Methylobacterium platani JCM 14648]OAS25791.1 RNA polymerase subunit sigma-70 [Methylobacterium platani]
MTRDTAPNPSAEARPGLSASIRSHLGTQLRETYESLGNADPDNRFAELVARLEAALKAQGEVVLPEFRDGLLQAVPSLRAFALSLTSNPARADDLVQDTLLKGWQHRARFQAGTNLNAWLFTILRNIFYSDHRKRVREVEDQDGSYAARLATAPHQGDRLDVEDLQSALAKLPPDQREALVLVGAEGVSYEEAAAIMGCKVGTVKSRVSRARGRLAELLGYDEEDLGTDRLIQSAMPKDA